MSTDRAWSEYARKRRVFILGAGFSAAAGVPLTISLLPEAMNLFKRECPGIYQRVCNYALDLQHENEEPDFASINFSELCTHIEFVELREFAGGERWSSDGCREKLALRHYLAKQITKSIPRTENIPQLYLRFAEQLTADDIVITFNWDTLLESAIRAIGKSVEYGFSKISTNSVRVYKLHGSVNWRLGKATWLGEERNTLNWRPIGLIDGGLLSTDFYYSDLLFESDVWDFYRPLIELQPFLVLPGYGKAFDVRAVSPLWYRPEFTFAACRDVFIIGLGLSPDDHFIRSFFLNNFPMPDRNTWIINPDIAAAKNYAFMLQDKNVTLLNESFASKHVTLMLDRLTTE